MYHKYYVYLHVSEDGRIIYCGIGTQGRAFQQTGRDSYHHNIISKYEHDYVQIVATHLDKEQALMIERGIIRDEDPVCNINERIH